MDTEFTLVAKTMKGLEATLADEIRRLGASDVEPGHRMVSFRGNLETLYRANLCLRTALRVLKPFHTLTADNPDTLYDRLKEFDWSTVMTPDSTFAIDTVMNSESFTHSRFATYRVKDAIVDWFRDRYDRRPSVRITDADIMINVHIHGDAVTLSLDSSGESLHKRGWRVASTEAPINEVLAAGILLMSGYDGSQPLVDPMCGSGTFLVEGALIAANINPGVFRREYAFMRWPDFDRELFDSLWNNDSAERVPPAAIVGADILPEAVQATQRNLKAAGVAKYVDVEVRKFSEWRSAPAPSGIVVMNPPYGKRISALDMEELYAIIGRQLKHLFSGWHAWIISTQDDFFHSIGLAPSRKVAMMNGSIECELREYVMFTGNKREFRAAGGRLKDEKKPLGRKDNFAAKDTVGKPRRTSEKPFGKRKTGKDFEPKSENRFAPKSGTRFESRFDRKPAQKADRAFDRKADRAADRKFDRTYQGAAQIENSSENPLAARRNPDALKALINRQPSLPKTDAPLMRSRRKKS